MISDFSVLIAVYKNDDPDLFRRSLESIFSNSLKPQEVILVADGDLTAELLSIIDNFLEKYPVKLLQLPENVGLAKALNIGLLTVKTTYTVRADADDINYPNRFQLLVSKLNEGFDLVGSAIREVDKAGLEVAYRICPLTKGEIRQYAMKRNPFNHMTVGFRTSVIVEAGGYPPIYLKEDYALWITLLSRDCKVCNIDAVLVDATAGVDMFRRRGGFKYALAEFELQCHIVKYGFKSPLAALLDGVIRSLIFLAPNFLREFVYLNFLREKKGAK